MKKTLFSSLLCVLLCAVMIFSPIKISPAQAAGSVNALLGTSLYFDDQVDLQLYFDSSKIDSSFTLTTTFDGKTYTYADLTDKEDRGSGATYKILTVGPFSATQYDTDFTYSGSHMKERTFSLTYLAKNSITYYKSQADYGTNKAVVNLVNLMEAFVNYGVAANNLVSGTAAKLPYDVDFTAPDFTVNPGFVPQLDDKGEVKKDDEGNTLYTKNPLEPTRNIYGRSFILDQDVSLCYYGTVLPGDNPANWTFIFNSVDVTDSCEFTIDPDDTDPSDGQTFLFRVPLQAEQGTDKLRVIVRDNTGAVLYDCIDKADAVAAALGAFPGWEELSQTLGAYLQAASAYVFSPDLLPMTFDNTSFYAGYSKVDITPYGDAVPLGSSTAKEFIDPIFATCVALRDNEGTISLIFSLDIRNVQSQRSKVYQTIRDDVAAKTGVDPDHIFFNATHNHNAPAVDSTDKAVTEWYNNYFYPRVPVAAKLALEDLTPVTGAYVGNDDTESGTNYNRRYKSGRYEDKADKNLRTIRFERAAGKDILMVNWQCHAAHGASLYSGKGTSDFIYQLRLKVESETTQRTPDGRYGLGMHLLYINGASGDLNMTEIGASVLPESTFLNNTKSVSRTIENVVKSDIKKELDTIKVKKTTLYADLHYRAHDDGTFCYDETCGICTKEYLETKANGSSSFNSEKQYSSYVDQKNNSNLKIFSRYIDLWTMTIGEDIGFAFVPYEMFNQNGVALREAVNTATGGGKTIFTAGYTNGYHGYMPSETAWAKVDYTGGKDDGAFEVDTAAHVRGTAERCIEQLTQDLTALFNN